MQSNVRNGSDKGTAALTATSNSVGSETLTATYTASGNFGGLTSAALTLGVTNPVTLTLNPYAVSIAPGASGTITVAAKDEPPQSTTSFSRS